MNSVGCYTSLQCCKSLDSWYKLLYYSSKQLVLLKKSILHLKQNLFVTNQQNHSENIPILGLNQTVISDNWLGSKK